MAEVHRPRTDYVYSDQFNYVKRVSYFLAEDFIVQLPGVTASAWPLSIRR